MEESKYGKCAVLSYSFNTLGIHTFTFFYDKYQDYCIVINQHNDGLYYKRLYEVLEEDKNFYIGYVLF